MRPLAAVNAATVVAAVIVGRAWTVDQLAELGAMLFFSALFALKRAWLTHLILG